MITFQAVEKLREQADVGLEADAFAGFDQMFPAYAAVFGVVQDQVGEFPALLHQMNIGEARDLFLESRRCPAFR